MTSDVERLMAKRIEELMSQLAEKEKEIEDLRGHTECELGGSVGDIRKDQMKNTQPKGCGILKILELFSGTESFSNVAKERGHECFTIDIEPKFKPELVKDIILLEKNDIPFVPDVIWASPPCQQYSHAKRTGIRDIDGANKNVLKALEIISWFPNCIWFIENPQTGLLKNQTFMKDLPFTDVSYCKYGIPYRKQTRIWNNNNFKGKICNKDCDFLNGKKHIGSAGNGRKKYTDKSYSRVEKFQIPKELCKEILLSIPPSPKGEGILEVIL